MFSVGHVAFSAFTIARCAFVSASVSALRGSSASLRVDASAPLAARRSCTARISSHPFLAASTQLERSSAMDVRGSVVAAMATTRLACDACARRGYMREQTARVARKPCALIEVPRAAKVSCERGAEPSPRLSSSPPPPSKTERERDQT
eukprot:31176-Pelagococcus_subviridis.AAC.30